MKQKILTIEDFHAIERDKTPVFIVKNSLTCPISYQAFSEVEKYADQNNDIPVYFLHVQEARQLSNYIANQYNVQHQSPQLLLIKEDKVVWEASHFKIKYVSMKKALSKYAN